MGYSVSIIVPVYNVERYLRECLQSVANQTLSNYEVICVNDGSTDGSLAIMREFAATYDHLIIVDKENGGYGTAMNAGLRAATGTYVGIVESDDFCDLGMFEQLYHVAIEHDADAVKSNFYRYRSFPSPRNEFVESLAGCTYNTVFVPANDTAMFYARPAIWSGLYRRDFLLANDIWFTETPGASYQDTAFNFKVWACAQRAVAVREAYLHYRVDNEGSSVKSRNKVFCVNDEYAEIERFLAAHSTLQPQLVPTVHALKFATYDWNARRLAPGLKYEFYRTMVREFKAANESGELRQECFSSKNWENVQGLLDNPDAFFSRYYGTIDPTFSVFLLAGSSVEAVERTVECLRAQKLVDFAVYCMALPWDSRVRERLLAVRQEDPRFSVLPYTNYLSGDLDASLCAGRLCMFVEAGRTFGESFLMDAYDQLQVLGDKTIAYLGAEELEPCNRASVSTSKAVQVEDVLRAYYDGQVGLPVVCGQCNSFEGLSVSPYALRVGVPLLCTRNSAMVVALDEVQPTGACADMIRDEPHGSACSELLHYRGLVDDFHAVQQACAQPIAKCPTELATAYQRYAYARVHWLKQLYKMIPDSVACQLPERYHPKSYSGGVVATHVPQVHADAYALTVVVCLHNCEHAVSTLAAFLQQQCVGDLEVVLVDCCSEDETLASAIDASAHDDRIVVVETLLGDVGPARNAGLKVARGAYVAFIDQKDMSSLPDLIDFIIQAVREGTTPVLQVPSQLGARANLSSFVFERHHLQQNDLQFADRSGYEGSLFVLHALLAGGRDPEASALKTAASLVNAPKVMEMDACKACDLLRGLIEGLRATDAGPSSLHTSLVRLVEESYYDAIVAHLSCPAVFELLVTFSASVSANLLWEQGATWMPYVARPLAMYPVVVEQQVGRLEQCETTIRVKDRALEWYRKQLARPPKPSRSARAIASVLKYARKLVRQLR